MLTRKVGGWRVEGQLLVVFDVSAVAMMLCGPKWLEEWWKSEEWIRQGMH